MRVLYYGYNKDKCLLYYNNNSVVRVIYFMYDEHMRVYLSI